ncbi:acyltransferase family protein [Catenuloplanes indicus]|uniref:acyltransferase family protein n=1 Tax=Catenuloplanes indicus TaxID=137267 RepID=UPI0035212A96
MRNRYLDLLRAAAVLRVVVYHVTGLAALTIVLPAMSVMFALGGSLMAASVDRFGVSAIGRRMRRLLPSLWAVMALFLPAMLLTGLDWDWRILFWVAPFIDPPASGLGLAALSANWYLRDFLWFVALSPLALPLFRRFPLPTIAAPFVLLVATELKLVMIDNYVLRDIGLYFGAWLLGFAHHDGMLRRLTWRRLVPIAAVLAIAGAAWFLTHPGPRGYDLNDIRIGNALWSTAFVLIALGLAPDALPWLSRRPRLDRLVTLLNSRALTIYLWHVPIIVGLGWVAARYGWPQTGALAVTVRLVIVLLLLAVAVAAFGWVEDVAAKRRPRLVPGRVRPRPAAPPEPARGTLAEEILVSGPQDVHVAAVRV